MEDLLKKLSREYLGDRYHLLYRNVSTVTLIVRVPVEVERPAADSGSARRSSAVQPFLRRAHREAHGAERAQLGTKGILLSMSSCVQLPNYIRS